MSWRWVLASAAVFVVTGALYVAALTAFLAPRVAFASNPGEYSQADFEAQAAALERSGYYFTQAPWLATGALLALVATLALLALRARVGSGATDSAEPGPAS